MAVRIRQVPHGGEAWRATVRLRHAVLRAPLGLAFTADELAAECAQLHLALDLAGALAGTAVLVPAADTWKLRQMAVAPALQGLGLGRALVEAAEGEMRDRGAAQVRLHARAAAVAFYAHLGYVADGAPFTEVTIPHRAMWKRFRPAPI